MHPVIYESSDKDLVKRLALKMRRDSGPSGMYTNRQRSILVSKDYGTPNMDSGKAFVKVKKIH